MFMILIAQKELGRLNDNCNIIWIRLKIGQQAMAKKIPNKKNVVYISVSYGSNMMILFYIYVHHLFQLLRNLNSLALFLFYKKLIFICHNNYIKAKCLKALNLWEVLSHTSGGGGWGGGGVKTQLHSLSFSSLWSGKIIQWLYYIWLCTKIISSNAWSHT